MIRNSRGLRYTLVAAGVVMALVACEEITGPSSDADVTPSYAISDGSTGKPGFYFMPPMVPTPKPQGTFDANLLSQLTVKVCELTGGASPACSTEIAAFTSSTNPAIKLGNDYTVKWDTKRARLSTSKTYRVSVLAAVPIVGDVQLGFVDVDVVSSNKNLKSVASGFAGLVKDGVLDIHFRVETEYVVSVAIDPRGGTVNLSGTKDFTAAVTGLHGVIADGAVEWSSSDTTITSVSPATGASTTVTGNAVGSAWLRASSNGAADSVQVTVSADAPIAKNDSANAVAGETLNGNLFGDNGSGPDSLGTPAATVISFGGGSLPGTVQAFALDSAVNLAGGKLSVNANGQFSLVKPRQAGRFTFLYRISNTSGSSDATVTLRVAPGTAYQLVKVGVDSASGEPADERTLEVKVLDSLGNSITGDSVSWSVTSGGGSVAAPSSLTDSTGVASIIWTFGTTAGWQTAQASRAGFVGSPVSFAANVTSASAGNLSVTQQPSGTAESGIAFAQQPTVQLKDQYGNPVSQSGVTVTASINSGAGTLGGTLTANTNASGLASFTDLKITGTTGKRTLIFTAPSLTSAVSDSIEITAGGAARIDKNSVDSAAGAPGSQRTLKVKVSDASGNGVAGQAIGWSVVTGGGSVDSATSVTDSLGVASIGWTLGTATGWQTAQAAASGLTNSPLTLSANVVAGAPVSLAIAQQPSSSATSGAVFATQPQIQLKDQFGNNAPYSGRAITVAINSGGGTLGGTVTDTTNAAGVVSFSDLNISGTPGKRTLVFTSPSLTSVVSDSIQINAGAAYAIAKNSADSASSQPEGTQTLKVKVTDADGNPVAGDSVSWSVVTGGGSVASPKSATDSAGVASIVWTLGPTAGWQTAQASQEGLTGSPITFSANVSAGSPAKLLLVQQSSDTATSGAVFARQPHVAVADQWDNILPYAGFAITAAINSGGGILGGTVSDTTISTGQLDYTNLKITGTPGKRTVVFSSPSLTSVVSDSITITAAGAGAMTKVIGDDTTMTVGKNRPVGVHLTDSNGDDAAGIVVRWKVLSGGGTIDSVATTDSFGRAIASWTLGTAPGDQTAEASADGYTNSPDTFTVHTVADSVYRVAIVTQPSTPDTSGVQFRTQPVVRLKDKYGNNVGQLGTQIVAIVASGTGTFTDSAAAIITTDSTGTATFTNLGISGPDGDVRLTFASSTLQRDTSQVVHIVNLGTRTWIGGGGTQDSNNRSWNLGVNWNPAIVPDSTNGVIIPGSGSIFSMPQLDQDRVLPSITLGSGSHLDLASHTLRIKTDVSGTGIIESGTLWLTSSTAQFTSVVPSLLITGAAQVNGSAVASGAVSVPGSLTVKDATLSIVIP